MTENLILASQNSAVAIVGATGYTARFVLDELQHRGIGSILIGRDPNKLEMLRVSYPQSETRVVDLDNLRSLDGALDDADAVINCAGPFLDTALPVVDAAIRAQIPYLDLSAEQPAVASIQARDVDARRAGVVLIPAAAFYGGLADLLATAILPQTNDVDEIIVAVALDSWHPTKGTRVTGQRNTARRHIVSDGKPCPLDDPQPKGSWTFPAPFGEQDVLMLPFSETLTISRHIKARTIESWINTIALRDVRDVTTPAPTPSDERGRSRQRFAMDVIVRLGEHHTRATAFGQDIYAVSAPIVVEGVHRLLRGEGAGMTGVRSLGEIFDARDFLRALADTDDLRLQYEPEHFSQDTMDGSRQLAPS